MEKGEELELIKLGWNIGQEVINSSGLKDSSSQKIVYALSKFGNRYGWRKRKSRTKYVKAILCLLGHKEGYRVYANGIHKRYKGKYKIAKEVIELSEEKWQNYEAAFKNTEWLYDVHWYTEEGDTKRKLYVPKNDEEKFRLNRLHLASEIEFGDKKNGVKFGEIKYDFLKLLTTNADLRLMVFMIRDADKLEEIKKLDMYFTDALNNYKNLNTGDMFLFVALCKEERKLLFKQIKKT